MKANPQLAEHKYTPQTQIAAPKPVRSSALQHCPEALWALMKGGGGLKGEAE